MRLQVVEAGYGGRFAERQTCSANEYAFSLIRGVYLQLRQFLSRWDVHYQCDDTRVELVSPDFVTRRVGRGGEDRKYVEYVGHGE